VGLDVVVYRNRKHIEMGPDNARANVFHKTGELYFEDDKNDKLLRKYQHKIQAVAHRLGDVALISTLNDEVSQLIGPESFLGRKILYLGTHSGDAIPLQEIDELSAEINRISETGLSSPMMQEFVSALEELIEAAKEEGNPIVFV
jgi:hypothetical protein